jgi:hypothetical protein
MSAQMCALTALQRLRNILHTDTIETAVLNSVWCVTHPHLCSLLCYHLSAKSAIGSDDTVHSVQCIT